MIRSLMNLELTIADISSFQIIFFADFQLGGSLLDFSNKNAIQNQSETKNSNIEKYNIQTAESI